MKAGARAIGVAESYRDSQSSPGVDPSSSAGSTSTLAAAVVRADRTVDGLAFGSCSVGGTDATEAIVDLVERLGRADGRHVMVSGIAPAWYNVLDLPAISAGVDRPVVSVSFEASEGLAPALREAFDGDALTTRLERYRRQPERAEVIVNGETLFVRAIGMDAAKAADLVRAFTPEGGRPEPIRVARLAARAADRWRADS